MLTILIPVGRFSYFVHACLKNVFDTAGCNFDFVFITSKDVSPEIELAFQEAKKSYQFRVLSATFNSGSNHLRLLDWAVREADLSDWFVVQHCDLFWIEQGWLSRIVAKIRNNLTVICTPCRSKHYYCGSNIPVVGDFFGVYNRKELIKRNLFFNWGILGKGVTVSEKVIKAINTGLIWGKNNRKIEIGKEWMDGSQAMSWELVVHDSSQINKIQLNFIHLTGFFRISDSFWRKDNTIGCDLELGVDPLVNYSFLSSFCIERKEIEDLVLPWVVLEKIGKIYGNDFISFKENFDLLKSYSNAKNIVGYDDLGIDCVSYCNEKFYTRLVKLL